MTVHGPAPWPVTQSDRHWGARYESVHTRSVGANRGLIPVHTDTSADGPLSLEVDDVLEQLVRGGDHPGVGLETTLSDNHLGELLAEVDVGHLDRAGGQGAAAAGAARADQRQARVHRRAEQRTAGLLETDLVVVV